MTGRALGRVVTKGRRGVKYKVNSKLVVYECVRDVNGSGTEERVFLKGELFSWKKSLMSLTYLVSTKSKEFKFDNRLSGFACWKM